MSKLDDLKMELQELRENTMSEFKEMESTDFSSEKKEEWAKRNEKMAELNGNIKEAVKIENERKEIEAGLEAGKVVEPKAIHTEPKADQAPVESLGQQFMNSQAHEAFVKNGQKNISSELKWNPQVELKTTLTETGYPPAVTRSPLIVPTGTLNPLQIPDLIDTIITDNYQYK